MTNSFSSITLSNWRQFDEVSIQLHPRLTIITGANGAGKSTILNVFTSHFGVSRPFLSLPRKRKGGGIDYDMGLHFDEDESDDDSEFDEFDLAIERFLRARRPKPEMGHFVQIGEIRYSNGVSSSLGFHQNSSSQSYGLSIQQQQVVSGVPISSHRFTGNYKSVEGITLSAISAQSAYDSYFGEIVTRLNGDNSRFTPMYRMKEALIGMAAFGEGNNHLEPNAELLETFTGFSDILRRVLPVELGFQSIVIRIPDIVLKTRTGDFVVDSSSGGISAIIEICWQIYLYSRRFSTFSVTLDEPENHLHPSMQRSMLSSLIDAFPGVQFIVATHSPFIVSAVEDSFVYALKYVGITSSESGFPIGQRRVQSVALDYASKAGTASDILREVLGVSVTIPKWAENRLEGIIRRYEELDLSADLLKSLRDELTRAGFPDFYPTALSKLVSEND